MNVTVIRDGVELQPWELRAGERIVRTEYVHDGRHVTLWVEPRANRDNPELVSDSAYWCRGCGKGRDAPICSVCGIVTDIA
jgi:hypothetical protein